MIGARERMRDWWIPHVPTFSLDRWYNQWEWVRSLQKKERMNWKRILADSKREKSDQVLSDVCHLCQFKRWQKTSGTNGTAIFLTKYSPFLTRKPHIWKSWILFFTSSRNKQNKPKQNKNKSYNDQISSIRPTTYIRKRTVSFRSCL